MDWDERIEDFFNYLKFEKNFSDHTLDAYVSDVRKLRDFATDQLGGVGPDEISYENLQE
ncbi:MAG: site-specific integrase, partial [Cloacibacterium sp.]|nr:site-specific integrase [Cloacibacterium sp.]